MPHAPSFDLDAYKDFIGQWNTAHDDLLDRLYENSAFVGDIGGLLSIFTWAARVSFDFELHSIPFLDERIRKAEEKKRAAPKRRVPLYSFRPDAHLVGSLHMEALSEVRAMITTQTFGAGFGSDSFQYARMMRDIWSKPLKLVRAATSSLYQTWVNKLIRTVIPAKTRIPPALQSIWHDVPEILKELFVPCQKVDTQGAKDIELPDKLTILINLYGRHDSVYGADDRLFCREFWTTYDAEVSPFTRGLSRDFMLAFAGLAFNFQQVYHKLNEIATFIEDFNPTGDPLISIESEYFEKAVWTSASRQPAWLEDYETNFLGLMRVKNSSAAQVYQCLGKWLMTPERHEWMTQVARVVQHRAMTEAARTKASKDASSADSEGEPGSTFDEEEFGGRLHRFGF